MRHMQCKVYRSTLTIYGRLGCQLQAEEKKDDALSPFMFSHTNGPECVLGIRCRQITKHCVPVKVQNEEIIMQREDDREVAV